MTPQRKWLPLLLALAFLLTSGAIEKREAAESKTRAGATEQTWPYETTADVKVRSGPGNQYKAVADIKAGTLVNVGATDGEWLKVISKHGNPPGYIPVRNAKPKGEPVKRKVSFIEGPYAATADTLVREGPGLHYKSVAKITKGTKVHVVEGEGDWLKVQSKHGNPPGYIEKRFAERQQGN